MTATTLRAPRLTNNRLDDLAVAIAVIDDNIEYLDTALQQSGLGASLQHHFTERSAALKRARAWIAGKVDADRAQRSSQA